MNHSVVLGTKVCRVIAGSLQLQWRSQKCRIGRALQGHAAEGSV